MRKFSNCLVVLLTLFAVSTSCWAQEPTRSGAGGGNSIMIGGVSSSEVATQQLDKVLPEDRRDAERVAQVFGGIIVEQYSGSFSFYRNLTNAWVDGYLQLRRVNGVFMITYLQVDGRVIVRNGDKPLGILPTNIVGETRNFSLWVSGYDNNGKYIVSGSFYTDLLNSGDPILVKLDPAQVRLVVPFTVPRNADSKKFRLSIPHNGFEDTFVYQDVVGGFEVYVDPTKVEDYKIEDVSTGIVYQEGKTDALAKNPVEVAEGSVINLLLPEEVVDVSFTSNQAFFFFDQQKLDSQVARPCTPPAATGCERQVAAKVYLVHVDRMNMFVTVSGQQSELFKVEVRKWVARGTMPLIDQSKSGPYPSVDIGTGYDTVVVTILAADPRVVPSEDFQVFISRF